MTDLAMWRVATRDNGNRLAFVAHALTQATNAQDILPYIRTSVSMHFTIGDEPSHPDQ